jgi:small subunit ribosomal protein S13
MARFEGVDIPDSKRAEISLTYLYGIGVSRSRSLLYRAGIDFGKRMGDLDDQQITALRNLLEEERAVEGDLRKEVAMNVRRLMEIGCYRGLRHRRGLPVRGQRTHTNARSRKGARRGQIANKKKATK